MKKALIISVLMLFACGAAFAQSAKFAAVYSDNPVIAASSAESCDATIDDPDPETPDVDDPEPEFDKDLHGSVLLATMKMPQGKEILAGISTESLILLNTTVKGKNGGGRTAAGYGKVAVKIFAYNAKTGAFYRPVPNGRIVLNARYQQLSATLGGVIDSCDVSVDPITGDGTIDVSEDCEVYPEEIGLLTKNQSANHFNVVFKDLPQGDYRIIAFFTVLSTSFADATVDGCAYASSFVLLGDRIVTLQDVRAVKGSIEEVDFTF
jgi:hypothetical protein